MTLKLFEPTVEKWSEYTYCLQLPCGLCRTSKPHRVPDGCVHEPNPSQKQFLKFKPDQSDIKKARDAGLSSIKDPEELLLILGCDGGWGAGKTDLVSRCLLGQGFNFGGTYLATAPTEDQLRETLRKRIMEIIRQELPSDVLKKDEDDRLGRVSLKCLVDQTRDFEILFIGYDQQGEGEKFRNYVFSGVAMDQAEKGKFSHIQELAARIRDPNVPRQAHRFWIAGNSGGSGWFYRKFAKEDERPAGWHGVRIKTSENRPNLPIGYEDSLRLNLGREKARLFLDAEEADVSGMLYPMFDPDKHVYRCEIIRADWTKVVAIDPGLDHPCAALWAIRKPNGVVHIYDEHFERGLSIPSNVAKIKGHLSEPHQRYYSQGVAAGVELSPRIDHFDWLIDPSSRKRNPVSLQSEADEWRRLGLPVAFGDNRRNIGVDCVRRLMEQIADDGLPKLRIDPRCRNLIRELEELRMDDDTDDDAADTARYICVWFESGGGGDEDRPTPGTPGFINFGNTGKPENYIYG